MSDDKTQTVDVKTQTVRVIEKRDYRLYDVAGQKFVARGDIAEMILSGRKFIIRDSETGDDITRTARTL